jgi:hypothetical protein
MLLTNKGVLDKFIYEAHRLGRFGGTGHVPVKAFRELRTQGLS